MNRCRQATNYIQYNKRLHSQKESQGNIDSFFIIHQRLTGERSPQSVCLADSTFKKNNWITTN